MVRFHKILFIMLFFCLLCNLVSCCTAYINQTESILPYSQPDFNQIHDKKFQLIFTKISPRAFNIKFSRVDKAFDEYTARIKFYVICKNNDGSWDFVPYVTELEPSQNYINLYYDCIYADILGLNSERYEITFPIKNEYINKRNINDRVYNLELQYWDPWHGKPYIKYKFYSRNPILGDADVIIHRNVFLYFGSIVAGLNTESDLVGLSIPAGKSSNEGTIHYDDMQNELGILYDIRDDPDEYYFNFK